MSTPITDQRERLIDKIRKCMRLAERAGTQEEAHAAFLRAQTLMAEHKIAESELTVEVKAEEIIRGDGQYQGTRSQWKVNLFHAVCQNFRCRGYFSQVWGGKKWVFKFYGEESDVVIANTIFTQAILAAENLANQYVTKRKIDCMFLFNRTMAKDWRMSYLEGFSLGFSEAFRKQTENNQALMVISRVPARVVESFERAMRGSRSLQSTGYKGRDGAGISAGRKDGQQFGGTRKGVR